MTTPLDLFPRQLDTLDLGSKSNLPREVAAVAIANAMGAATGQEADVYSINANGETGTSADAEQAALQRIHEIHDEATNAAGAGTADAIAMATDDFVQAA
jgi:hypothetical protein